jgi:hypothetical protein
MRDPHVPAYDVAPTSSQVLKEHIEEIRRLAKRTVEDIIETGHHLVACQPLVRGDWPGWLKEEFGFSEDTALNFMRIFKMSENRNFRDLNIGISPLILLAAPSVSEQARDEAFKQVEDGEPLSVAGTKELIRKYKVTARGRGNAAKPPPKPIDPENAAENQAEASTATHRAAAGQQVITGDERKAGYAVDEARP